MIRIPTYVINLEKRTDRKQHILDEFQDKPEFSVSIVKAIEHENGGRGLWLTISHIIRKLINPEERLLLLVEDDHEFTNYYNSEFFMHNLLIAESLGADILLGGVSWFYNGIPATRNIYSLDTFNATQFVVIFQKFYKKLLKHLDSFSKTADINFSKIADKKMVVHPFISIQKEFGYSDATSFNSKNGYVTGIFAYSEKRLATLTKILDFYELP